MWQQFPASTPSPPRSTVPSDQRQASFFPSAAFPRTFVTAMGKWHACLCQLSLKHFWTLLWPLQYFPLLWHNLVHIPKVKCIVKAISLLGDREWVPFDSNIQARISGFPLSCSVTDNRRAGLLMGQKNATSVRWLLAGQVSQSLLRLIGALKEVSSQPSYMSDRFVSSRFCACLPRLHSQDRQLFTECELSSFLVVLAHIIIYAM